MKKYPLLLLLLGFCIASGFAQAHRVPPPTGGKANQRSPQATPKPTPTPEDSGEADPIVESVVDSGDVVKVDTKLVTIPVRVVDRNNRFVGGLARADFTVLEDNVPQELEYFSNEEQPFTVALVLDMSYSTKFKIAEIQSAAIEFIDQLRDQDKVMVVSFDEDVHVLCEPTNDRQQIYRAIKSTKITTGTSLYEAIDLVMNQRLRHIKGRRAIILFTDGVDTTSRRANSFDNLDDAMELDALVYPIRYDTFADVQAMKDRPVMDPSAGQTLPTGQSIPIPGRTQSKLPFPLPLPSVGTPSGAGTSEEDYRKAQEYLDQLALRTGGQLYVANNTVNLAGAFSKIASELREFYSLGYYPRDDAKRKKVRMLKVRVDKKGFVVRARDKYVVADETASKK
jgi:VWFA-related protein